MNQANEVLGEMVADGAITKDERERMVLGAAPRRRGDLMAPLFQGGKFDGVTVEDLQVFSLPDSLWADYEAHGNGELLARGRALFFRSVFMPSLASALTNSGDAERVQAFAERLENGLTRRLQQQPTPMNSVVQAIVVAKVD